MRTAVARLGFLSSAEEELLHEKSLEVLGEIGVLVRSKRVLSLLGESGALIDEGRSIARLPESMVLEALRRAPRDFTLCARERENDLGLPAAREPWLTTDGLTLYMRDLETGKERDATRADFADFARLADALDAVSFFWPIVTISDVPPRVHNLYEIWTSFQNCALHVQGDCTNAQEARAMIRLASLIVGGEEELRERPIFSCATDPISPLSFDEGAVEAQVEFARAGVPVLCQSMCMSGMSAPVTIAGTIVNLNAENLASIVITQCAAPGAPHIYGSCSTPVDMITGGIDFAAAEGMMISAASGQMARRYGRPCMVANWGMGRGGPGIQMPFSEAFSYVSGVLSGSDLAAGIGGLDDAKGCSMEQMVLDSLVWENFREFLRGFAIDDGTAALEVMSEVGHCNSFLAHPHTLRNFRRELSFWDKSKLALEATLSDGMIPEAKGIATALLKRHHPSQLDSDITKEGERILKEHQRQC